MIRPWEFVFLVSLGLVNVWLAKMLGYIPGDFYTCLSERDLEEFKKTMRRQVFWVLVCSASFGCVSPLSELLSLRWRRRLTLRLHGLYAGGQRYYKVKGDVDNPDQRIQRDADFVCKALATVANLLCTSPFKILYFTFLAHHYLGTKLLLAMYAYFVLTLTLQKAFVDSVAPLVVKRERAEAEFRSSHYRIRGKAEEIALCGSTNETRERDILNQRLGGVLSAQKKLVVYHWGLSLSSSLIDYLGSAMNYLILGIAIFSKRGVWDKDAKDLPREISNASFIIFQLIYSFSQLCDTAKNLSDLLGYAERVGELIEGLGWSPDQGSGATDPEAGATKPGGGCQEKRGPSEVLVGRQPAEFLGRSMEYSIHRVEGKVYEAARSAFPDLGLLGEAGHTLLAVPTFQLAAPGVDLNPDSGCPTHEISFEMNKLHRNYVALESEVYRELTLAGYFCDSVDPLTGGATHTRLGSRYNEVRGAQELLGYQVRELRGHPLVLHPNFGSSCYPATIFSTAPVDMVQACLEKALWKLELASDTLVSVKDLRLSYGSRTIFDDLSFDLKMGGSLYVRGNSGCGKSTLVRALCNLVEVDSGEISMPDLKLVVVLCQTPLLVSGGTVSDQISYPKTAVPAADVLSDLLEKTGLTHLQGFGGRVEQLSKGDVQRICIARVLYHKPLLAILDDALNALPAEDQDQMHARLQESNIAFISTGSGPSGSRRVGSALDIGSR
ncbi:ABC transporter [Chloropicon primus]|nr:ABC transporter [Chloropicon primus]